MALETSSKLINQLVVSNVGEEEGEKEPTIGKQHTDTHVYKTFKIKRKKNKLKSSSFLRNPPLSLHKKNQ